MNRHHANKFLHILTALTSLLLVFSFCQQNESNSTISTNKTGNNTTEGGHPTIKFYMENIGPIFNEMNEALTAKDAPTLSIKAKTLQRYFSETKKIKEPKGTNEDWVRVHDQMLVILDEIIVISDDGKTAGIQEKITKMTEVMAEAHKLFQ